MVHMLLLGKPVIKKLSDEISTYIEKNKLTGKYVAIFLLSDDTPSEVYVGKKAKKAEKIGIYADIKLGKLWDVEEVIDEIQQCNFDTNCIGIMVQLPLADHLKEHQMRILDTIIPEKDVDGLGTRLFGLA
jgi:5,10-methylene-tetrahydrofolate dehydrogenase/methenyl tetrahydrofolate cyclohydrolase